MLFEKWRSGAIFVSRTNMSEGEDKKKSDFVTVPAE